MPRADTADPPLTEHTVYLLSQLGRAGKRLLVSRLAEHGLKLGHMAALSVFEESGALSQADLGRRLGLDPSDVTALVDELRDLGLAERTVDPGDRRRRLVRRTDDGAGALELARSVTRAVDDELLAPLSLRPRNDLHAALLQVLLHVRAG